jgi:two-component system, NarL family, response regulator NreC
VTHTSILVCDDHTIYREGVKIILGREPDLKVIGEARDSSDAIRLAALLKPDVMLLDLSLPGGRALDTTRHVRKDGNIRVLVLGMYDDEEIALQCRDAGASGYVLKDTHVLHLLFAVRHVRKSGHYLTPASLGQMNHSTTNPKSSKDADLAWQVLSSRQREILLFLAEGFSYKEIGARLHLSVKTVDTHKYNLMRKLNIQSRAGLIRFAIRQRLIEA